MTDRSRPLAWSWEDGADGPYTTTPVTYTDVGTNTVLFTVEKAGYVPYSGSAKVIIDANDGSPLPIEPGETSHIYETEEAATNEQARLVVTFPADLAEFATAEQKAYYCSLFHVVTKKVGDRWQNVVEFTPEATTALRKTLDDALKTFDLSKITTEDTNWVVSNPVMGLYYALERTDTLAEDFKVHDWDIGNSVSVAFAVSGGDAPFSWSVATSYSSARGEGSSFDGASGTAPFSYQDFEADDASVVLPFVVPVCGKLCDRVVVTREGQARIGDLQLGIEGICGVQHRLLG